MAPRNASKSKRQYANNSPAVLMAKGVEGVKGTPFPGYIQPSLASAWPKPPNDNGWVHEIKFDGYRLQIHKQESNVQCFTRRGYDWSAKFPSLVRAAWYLKAYNAILDGEVMVVDKVGQSDFERLESYVSSKNPDQSQYRALYYAFDLLYLDGLDLRGATLIDRKRVLVELLGDVEKTSPLVFSGHLVESGTQVYANACRIGLEGIVSKRARSKYQSDRNNDWVKVTCRNRETFVVAGIAYKGSKFDGVYLARKQNGKLVYAGKVENGFSEAQKRHMAGLAKGLQTTKKPFAEVIDKPKGHWLKPAILADVEYRSLTKRGGLLRHPSYKGIREDL